jgi:hypothetical protein
VASITGPPAGPWLTGPGLKRWNPRLLSSTAAITVPIPVSRPITTRTTLAFGSFFVWSRDCFRRNGSRFTGCGCHHGLNGCDAVRDGNLGWDGRWRGHVNMSRLNRRIHRFPYWWILKTGDFRFRRCDDLLVLVGVFKKV